LQPGDQARIDEPLIGIVDANAWRVIANYKQSYLPLFQVGRTAWVWLDSHPWRFYRGRIVGIARGISRTEGQDKLLPYVAPTTDWIRLQHRFPVTITLVDPPPDLTLYMGADARTVIFP
jgi:multidrug efflux system membrane fusion protein